MNRVRVLFGAALAIFLLSLSTSASAGAAFRAGDVGQSLMTPRGQIWIYGDSWAPNGGFIRNAITLDGKYMGTINRGVPKGHWMWLGAPFLLPNGKVAVYGSEMYATGTTMWSFARAGQVYVTFWPSRPSQAEVVRLDDTSSPWSFAAARDAGGPLVYKNDAKHHPMVGRPQADGSVVKLANLKADMGGAYGVLKDPWGQWWMVGAGPMLSRRIWGYRLASPQGPVVGSKVLLTTLPDPGSNRYVYATVVHPEENGLLTWAVNGHGPGAAYGLRRIEGFLPNTLSQILGKTLPSADSSYVSGLASPIGRGPTSPRQTLGQPQSPESIAISNPVGGCMPSTNRPSGLRRCLPG